MFKINVSDSMIFLFIRKTAYHSIIINNDNNNNNNNNNKD